MGYRVHPLAAAVALAFSSSAVCQGVAAQDNSPPLLGDVVVSAGKLRPLEPDATTLNERALAPLRAAPGVLRVDTSEMNITQVVEHLLGLIRQHKTPEEASNQT